MKIFKGLFWLIMIATTCLGFRTYDGTPVWNIDATTTANSKLFVSFSNGTRTVTNNVESDHSLYGSATVTVQQMMTAIYSDYNSIQSAYVTLVDESDADFASRGTNRTITLVDGSAGGVQAGVARFTVDANGYIDQCTITLSETVYENSKTFLGVVAHEMGHCLGLDHPQDTVNALMSYYRGEIYELAIDDKMGIVTLYPSDPAAVELTQTFGLSCSRKQ